MIGPFSFASGSGGRASPGGQRLRVIERGGQALQHGLGVERADRHRRVQRNATLGLQQLVAQAAHAQEGREIGRLAAVFDQLVVEAFDELRDPHAVAAGDFLQHLPEQLLQPQAGGHAVQAQRTGFRRIGLLAGADEDFTHGSSGCGDGTACHPGGAACHPMYDDRCASGKALTAPVPDAGILIHVMVMRGQTADDRDIDHTTEDPMDKTMKAAVARAFGKPLAIEEVAVPRPGAGELLVKIEACGVCHTDLHAVEGDWPVKPNPPFIPGHEGVGHVVAVGAGVTHVKEGDSVGIPWLYSACGHCEHCLGGWETLCEQQQNAGYSVNGGFAEYALAAADYVGLLPANIGFVDIAPVLCAGVTVYKGLKMTDTRPGNWVVISGIGGLGHMAVQYARAMGLNVAAVDIDDAKLELARKLGAEVAVNARTTDPAAYLKREIGGAHGALITAVSPKAFEQALGMVRRGGTVALNGLPPGDFPLSIFDMVLNGVTVRGSIVGSRLDLQESLQFAAEGKVRATVATERLENINHVFDRMRSGQIEGRVVLDFA